MSIEVVSIRSASGSGMTDIDINERTVRFQKEKRQLLFSCLVLGERTIEGQGESFPLQGLGRRPEYSFLHSKSRQKSFLRKTVVSVVFGYFESS